MNAGARWLFGAPLALVAPAGAQSGRVRSVEVALFQQSHMGADGIMGVDSCAARTSCSISASA
jgi:hypothetical protein